MKRLLPTACAFALLALVGLPLFVQAAESSSKFIICGTTDTHPCTFTDLFALFKIVINYLIIVSAMLATAMLALAGWKLITSMGNPAAKNEAKQIAWKVLWGYIWILAAWLLVYTISTALLKSGYSFLSTSSS